MSECQERNKKNATKPSVFNEEKESYPFCSFDLCMIIKARVILAFLLSR